MERTEAFYTTPTKNVAVRMFANGCFDQARKEMYTLRSGANDLDVLVMVACCDSRLGDTQDAIAQCRANIGHKLTADHKNLLFWHEVLSYVQFRRFNDAIKLIESAELTSDELAALGLIRQALQVLRQGQATPFIRRRQGKIGITTAREARITYLPKAFGHCFTATAVCSTLEGDNARLIHALGGYILLLIVQQMSDPTMRERDQTRALRKQLSGIDKCFTKSLPSTSRLVNHRHRF